MIKSYELQSYKDALYDSNYMTFWKNQNMETVEWSLIAREWRGRKDEHLKYQGFLERILWNYSETLQ
jgi:hypothetical protein